MDLCLTLLWKLALQVLQLSHPHGICQPPSLLQVGSLVAVVCDSAEQHGDVVLVLPLASLELGDFVGHGGL